MEEISALESGSESSKTVAFEREVKVEMREGVFNSTLDFDMKENFANHFHPVCFFPKLPSQ
jgi:hypothetical protein